MVQQFREREVNPSGQTPGYQSVNYSPDSFGAQVGRALSGLGDTLNRSGAMIAELDSQKKANDALTQANSAKDELRPVLFDHEFGVFAQNGGNAMGSGATTSAALENIKQKYLKNISDPETKTAFERIWLKESEATKDAVARHEMTQLGNYGINTAKATLSGAMTDAYNSYTDQNSIDKAINDSITAIRVNQAGLPPEAVEAAEAEARSKIHLAVISRWSNEDPYKAMDYYTKHKDQLDGPDHITATQFIGAVRSNQKAQENVARITGAGASAHWLWGAMIGAESSGNPNAESPKGASGLYQVMPGTAREVAASLGINSLDGLTDDEVKAKLKTDTGLNTTLGQSFMNTQLKRYNGDVEAALVAYNAGPAAADAFLKHNAGRAPGSRDYDVPGWKGVKSESESYVQKILGQRPGNRIPAGQRMTADNWTLKNFKPSDLMAPTAGGQWVDARAATALDNLADTMGQRFPGFKIKINEETTGDPNQPTAGRRRGTSDPKDNPHVTNSQHVTGGTAFDVQVQGWTDEQKAAFLTEARQLGFSGVGFYGPNGHLHVDMGKERTWGAVPDWAKGPMGTPVVRGAGGERVTSDWQQQPQGQNFFDPGASMGDSGFFMDPKAGALDQWLAQAQLIADPSERERTIALLRVADAQATAQRDAEAAAIKQGAWDFVTQGNSPSKLPPELLSRLDPSFVNTLYAFESNQKSGGPTTDWQAYYEATRKSQEELVATDIYTEYRNRLADAEFQKLITLQQEATKALQGQDHDAALLSGTQTRTQIVDDIVAMKGWDSRNQNHAKSIGNLNQQLNTRILGEQAILKRALNADEIRDIADKLLIEDQYDGWGWDPSRNAMTATSEQKDTFVAASDWTEVQSDDQKTLIDRYEREFGSLPTDDTAIDLYNRSFRVWLGAKPDGPDEEKTPLRDALEARLKRKLTDTEFERAYAKFLLAFLGR